MNKPLIHIPEPCKPTSEIMYGYSGGMGLYVADWNSVRYLFNEMPPQETNCFSYYIINFSTVYN